MIDHAAIQAMSTRERLQAMEQLWDILGRDVNTGEVPSPAWHADVLAARRERAERGEAVFLTLPQLRARLHAAGP